MPKIPKNSRLFTRVKTAKGRKGSSTRWLQRQLNDPYVKQAKADGYRSRAAYKLLEIDEKASFLKQGKVVVDLGAAPGGWCQVAVKKVGKNNVVGIDLLPIDPIEGVTLLQLDFTEDEAEEAIAEALQGRKVDIVLSDMAAPTTGTPSVDHLRIMHLCELVFEFCTHYMNEDGVMLTKIFQGGAEQELLTQLKKSFKKTRHIKPNASRKDSSEMYLLAEGFKTTS